MIHIMSSSCRVCRVESYPPSPDGQDPKNLSSAAGDPRLKLGFRYKEV